MLRSSRVAMMRICQHVKSSSCKCQLLGVVISFNLIRTRRADHLYAIYHYLKISKQSSECGRILVEAEDCGCGLDAKVCLGFILCIMLAKIPINPRPTTQLHPVPMHLLHFGTEFSFVTPMRVNAYNSMPRSNQKARRALSHPLGILMTDG